MTNVWGVEEGVSKGMPDSADVHVQGSGGKKGKLRKVKKGCVVTG